MTKEELNFIKDAFSQIIDDIAGNPDWQDAASAVASNLGTLERQLKKRALNFPPILPRRQKKTARSIIVLHLKPSMKRVFVMDVRM